MGVLLVSNAYRYLEKTVLIASISSNFIFVPVLYGLLFYIYIFRNSMSVHKKNGGI